jgi:hypothetical protein
MTCLEIMFYLASLDITSSSHMAGDTGQFVYAITQ